MGRKWELLGVKIVQGYGTTEAAPVISNHSLKERRLDSAGRPLPNLEVKISGEGEILVRGDNIMPGLLAGAGGDGGGLRRRDWYMTGDLGFIDEEGFLHIQGRKKDMIVLSSGQNVFPEDIQAVLSKHPNVTDAAVVGLTRGPSVEVHAALILDDAGEGPGGGLLDQRAAGGAAEDTGLHRLGRRGLSPHPHPQGEEGGGDRHHPGENPAGELSRRRHGLLAGARQEGVEDPAPASWPR